jgi:hypothetical protein
MGEIFYLVLLLLVVLIVVALALAAKLGKIHAVGQWDALGASEQEARYTANVGRSVLYEDGEWRYKVYPLCCPECRKHAYEELEHLKAAQAHPAVARLEGHWEGKPPGKNVLTDYPHLVLRLEPTRPLSEVESIDWPQFREAIETAGRLGAALGRDLDTSFGTIQAGRRGVVLAQLDHPRFPKTTIAKCLRPELFGPDAAAYAEWAKGQTKK